MPAHAVVPFFAERALSGQWIVDVELQRIEVVAAVHRQIRIKAHRTSIRSDHRNILALAGDWRLVHPHIRRSLTAIGLFRFEADTMLPVRLNSIPPHQHLRYEITPADFLFAVM